MITFADPFEQLLRSHRRLEERLAELQRATARVTSGEDVQTALEDIADTVEWLRRAGGRHEQDEEQSVFPRLPAQLAPLIARLGEDHRLQARLAGELGVLAEGALQDRANLDAAALARCVRELAESYARHIEAEERELFPAARVALLGETQREIVLEMDARRPSGGGGGGGGGGGRGGGGAGGGGGRR